MNISFRLSRLQTDSGNMETFITNLDPDRCPPPCPPSPLPIRWGIETSLRSPEVCRRPQSIYHQRRPEPRPPRRYSAVSSIFNLPRAARLGCGNLRASQIQAPCQFFRRCPFLRRPSCAAPAADLFPPLMAESCFLSALAAPLQGLKSSITAISACYTFRALTCFLVSCFFAEFPPSFCCSISGNSSKPAP